jgi:hypothetical protein
MARSHRENSLMIGAAAAVGVFLLWQYLYTPYVDARESVAHERKAEQLKLSQMELLFSRERRLKADWADMTAAGLDAGAADVELSMLNALQTWAQQSALANVSLRPQRTNSEHGFVKVSVGLSGSGPTSAMAKLLWCIESANKPVRVEDVHLTPTKEGIDDVQLKMTVSQLCAAAAVQKADNESRARVLTGGEKRGRR